MSLARKGRRLGAHAIMRKDLRAQKAYHAMRARGLSAKEARTEIEYAFEQCFREVLLYEVRHPGGSYWDADRREEVWLSLAE